MLARFSGKCSGCNSAFAAGAEVYWDKATRKITKCPACANGAKPAAGAPAAPESSEPKPPRIAAREAQVILPATMEAARAAFDARFVGLDPDQAKVVAWRPGDGNLRVVAAAGSGKTATTVALVGRLLWDEVVKPSDVIVTTFTSKAGKELVERLARVLPLGALDASGAAAPGTVRAGTFHGLALRALRRETGNARWDMSRCLDIGKGRSAAIPGMSRLWSMVLGYAGETGLPGTGRAGLDMEDADVRSYMLAVDVERAHGHSGEALREALAQAERDLGLPDLVQAWDNIVEVKFALGAWDFADVLEAYLAGLTDRSLTDGAKVVIVDEAQDNNKVQIDTALALARNGNGEVIFVGDLRQSIYSWRGAVPGLFRNADETINAKTLELPNNYRSVSEIVEVGNRVADGKSWSLGGAAKAARKEAGTVTVQGYEDPAAEAEAVANEVGLALRNGQSASDFAVLTRTNAMAGCYEAALVAARIPCVVVGGTAFFARREVKDVLAYLTLTKKDDIEAFGRIINRPRRYLGKKFVSQVQYAMNGRDLLGAITYAAGAVYRRQAEAAHGLRSLLVTLRAAEWPDVVERVAALLAPVDSGKGGEADEDRSGIPAAVAAIAKTFDSCEEFLAFAARCAGEVAEADEGTQVEGRVTISTLHKAKGLEWRTVFLSASAGVFPHIRCDTEERLDEEERLFYVGATRARDTLHLTYALLNLRGQTAGPSRFLVYAEGLGPNTPPDDDGGAEPAPLLSDEESEFGITESGAPVRTHAQAKALERVEGYGDEDDTFIPTVAPERAAEAYRAAAKPAPAVETYPSAAEAVEKVFGAAWAQAQAHAETLTAGEPQAVEGEGGRYVEVAAESFVDLLQGLLGFDAAPPDVEAKVNQKVWQRTFPAGDGTVALRVFSSIPLDGVEAREVGEDSIKVSVVYRAADSTERERPVLKKLPYACRTRGWRITLLKRIAEVAPVLVAPACPKCEAPMATRTTRVAKVGLPRHFLGCVRYPNCDGTRKIAANGEA